MTTINDLEQINAEAMMTLSEIGFAAYERFLGVTLKTHKGSIARIKIKSWLADRAAKEVELSHRIKVAPMNKESHA